MGVNEVYKFNKHVVSDANIHNVKKEKTFTIYRFQLLDGTFKCVS